uniref:Translocation protein SEC62 n=1 Tax=Steinernema glaseri TaxID=37863 RepID=A0A1I8A368_9BILA
MAERRRGRRTRGSENQQQLTKEDDVIARYVRFNCPTKSTTFERNEVQYFTGSKAVDTLYESKWGTKATGEPAFPTRHSAFLFLKKMMEYGLFFRARKLVQKKKTPTVATAEKTDVKKSPKQSSTEKSVPKEDNDKEVDKKEVSWRVRQLTSCVKEDEDKKKKQKKVKLVEQSDQYFADSNDVYIWVFDPTPLYKKIIGGLIIIGCLLGCLFPLWPHWLRLGVYYLSIVGISAFGVLIGVAVARTILFAIIWIATLGRHKLWILPNLTEDCGFFESFQPFYSYEYCPKQSVTKDKKPKTGKDKKSASEESDRTERNDTCDEEDENSDSKEENKQQEVSDETNVSGVEDQDRNYNLNNIVTTFLAFSDVSNA